MIKYECSNGERVSESTIKKRLSAAYRQWYDGGEGCAGCWVGRASETSHIISKARCKELHKTELIWNKENTFPSCRRCHLIWETTGALAWCNLLNVDRCIEVLEKYDTESYNKRMIIYEEAHLRTTTHLGLYQNTKKAAQGDGNV